MGIKMREKLITCVMGDNCVKFLDMCFDSVLESEKIIFCWGEEDIKTKDKYEEWEKKYPDKFDFISLKYDQDNLGQNGITRNFYLNYLKENYKGYWVLCLDADEVVDDLSKIKEFIQLAAKDKLYSPRMRHLMHYLNYEDATQETHYVLHRLFYIGDDLIYPEVEHPVLQGKDRESLPCNVTVVWHLAYICGLWDILKRYKNHLKKSNIHTPDYLKRWYYTHIFGSYPKRVLHPFELPKSITDTFMIDRDELYFIDRDKMEPKHYQDAIDWKDYFKPKNCLIYGCGMGQRVYTSNKLGIRTVGVEISNYAVKNKLHENVIKGDIIDMYPGNYDLVIAYDVLEHLEYKDLDKAIENMKNCSNKHILVSLPVKGNPALEIDTTHIIKESEKWWLNKFFEKGLKRVKTPDNFLFKEQIYIFEK